MFPLMNFLLGTLDVMNVIVVLLMAINGSIGYDCMYANLFPNAQGMLTI